MQTKTKEVFYCEHCNKHGLSKSAMLRHEKFCSSNPLNQHACYTCKHLKHCEGEDIEIHYEGGGNILTRHEKGAQYFSCEKLNKTLYNIVALRKKLPEKYPEHFEGQELMPTNCDSWEFNTRYARQEADTFL